MSAKPVRVLVVTSDAAPPESVEPVVRAMDKAGIEVALVDAGRAGTRVATRRILRGLLTEPPEVAFAFDPASTRSLCVARDEGRSMAPVVGVMPELSPRDGWSDTSADRYLTMDDSAAVALTDTGVVGERVIAIGPIGSRRFAETVSMSRSELRAQFKLETPRVVLVEVSGLGYETTQQVALQLGLIGHSVTTLFDAGTDREAATALRRQVPTLGMRAKLFGRSDDAPRYWRMANLVVARPTLRAVSHALLLGARFVSLAPEGERQEKLAMALEDRGIAATAKTMLLTSSAIEQVLASSGNIKAYAGRNGARIAADVARVIAADREGVLAETREAAEAAKAAAREAREAEQFVAEASARAEAKVTAPPSELEDLGGGDLFDLGGGGPSAGAGGTVSAGGTVDDLARMRAELNTRIERMKQRIWEARKGAEQWDRKHQEADAGGRDELARQASKSADAERARMHTALQELAQLEKERKRLEDAAVEAASRPKRAGSSVDDLLEQMKREQGAGGTTANPGSSGRRRKKRKRTSVEDELEALKRKMKKTT